MMSVDDLNDALFSQDDRAEIGYGGHNDFVSKLIEKARSNNQNAVKTPPPSKKTPGGRLAVLRRQRRNSQEVESALRALKIPARKVNSPGPVTRSQTLSGTPTRDSRSNPSLDDSTETLFGAIPPTPPLKRTPKQFTPRNNRVVPFTGSDVNSSSTPVSTLNHSARAMTRLIDRAATSSLLGLDKSTGSIGYRCRSRKSDSQDDDDNENNDDDDEESIEDLLLEATQQAEAKYAQSQQVPKSRSPKTVFIKSRSSDTPKTAGGRIRTTLTPRTSQSQSLDAKAKDSKEKFKSSQTYTKLSQDSKIPISQSNGYTRPKCSMEEIQRKREAALLRRKQKMSVK